MLQNSISFAAVLLLAIPVFGQNTITLDVTASPTTVCEGSEVNLTATITNPINYAWSFDGGNDHISVPDNAVLEMAAGTNFTLEAWMKTTDNTAAFKSIVSKGIVGETGYRLGVKDGLLYGETTLGPVTVGTVGNTAIDDGNWHHVAYVVDVATGEFTLYLNGFVDAVTNATLPATPAIGNTFELGIGCAFGAGGADHFFFGDIDEVRIWSRDLTASELQSKSSTHINPDLQMNLIGYWDLNEESSASNLLDCSTSGMVGAPQNGVTNTTASPTLGWNFGVTWSTGDQGLTVVSKPTASTLYSASAGYCKYQTTSDVFVTVDPCDSTVVELNDYSSVWVPNSFTPNGDFKNDVFIIQANNITGYEIMVFNRLGNILYHSQNIKDGWTGTDASGKQVAEGTYVYKVLYIDQDGNPQEKQGHITIYR